jgi:hypothetical protein
VPPAREALPAAAIPPTPLLSGAEIAPPIATVDALGTPPEATFVNVLPLDAPPAEIMPPLPAVLAGVAPLHAAKSKIEQNEVWPIFRIFIQV